MKYLGFLVFVTLGLVLVTGVGDAQHLTAELGGAMLIASELEEELFGTESPNPESLDNYENVNDNMEDPGLAPITMLIVFGAAIILSVLFVTGFMFLTEPDMEELNFEDDLEYAREEEEMNNNEIAWRNQYQRHGHRRSL